MTTKDKTGDQLMASIRRAKTEGATPDKAAGEAPKAAPATRKTAAATAKPTAAKPAAAGSAAKRPPAKKKVTPTQSSRGTQTAASAEGTGYQLSGRVWPD